MSVSLRRNAVHCNVCDTTIESLHRHDYRSCRCDFDHVVSVDGGHDYLKRSWGKFADFTEIDEPYVEPEVPTLEHTDLRLLNVHHPSRCMGEYCTLHNRSNHSKRSWVQHWNSKKRRMERVSPTSGRHYKDPDDPCPN